jgi:hypothetical protein
MRVAAHAAFERLQPVDLDAGLEDAREQRRFLPQRRVRVLRFLDHAHVLRVLGGGAPVERLGDLHLYVYDAASNRSDVVILAAQDFSASPLATIHLPQRVPFGFHGNWLVDES